MSRYRALLARPGALRVAAACVAGWLSFSSYGFAIVLAVRAATGSFQLAGAASAMFAAGAALLAPGRGRAVDRLGWPALAGLASLHIGAMAVLVAVGALGWATWLLLAAAAVAGAAVPPLIATAASHGGTVALALVALPPLAGAALVLARRATIRSSANAQPGGPPSVGS